MKFPGKLRPTLTSLLIGVLVFVVTALVWRTGLFQEPELWVYDHFVFAHSDSKATDPRFVLVLQDEKDIESLDYPLLDSVFAKVLDKIESGGPTVIGNDLYRDLPEPRDGTQNALFAQALLKYPNIVSIALYDTPAHPFAVPPPPAVANDPSRFGVNNLIYDHKTIRRAVLLLPFDKQYAPNPSFALLVSQYFLAAQNVSLAQDGDDLVIGKTRFHRVLGNEGGYVNVENAGHEFLQDFLGPRPDHFQSVSIQDVLKMTDTSMFKDKIVLIGSSADSGNDVEDTPIGPRVPGVIIHAQIINQILRAALEGNKPTRGVGEGMQWPWLLLWCVVGVGIGFFVRSHIIFALGIVAALAALVLAGWMLFLHGWWIIVFGPAIGFLASAMLVKAYAASYEEQERANLMKLFSQHVSTEIAEEIWTQRELFLQGGRPTARRAIVTVLFSDLKNYSTISEKMDAAELIAWVNECLGALSHHVHQNRGIVNTYMGDGMMAVFGIPLPRKSEAEYAQDAVNAVQCAIGMAGEIRRMNEAWKAQGKPLAGMRVGIFTGEAAVGLLGTQDHLEYSVIGDTVNTASRLESVDKEELMTGGTSESRILIGSMTYRFVKDKFEARQVGTVNLKGKKEETEVYHVTVK